MNKGNSVVKFAVIIGVKGVAFSDDGSKLASTSSTLGFGTFAPVTSDGD